MPTREYDREFTTPVGFHARRRVGFDTHRGHVVRFVVQLKYRIGDEWLEVVRFDHDPESEHGRDVTNDGVHMDVYRNGEQIRTVEIFPPMSPNDAFTFAEEHLAEHAKQREVREMARDRSIEPMTDGDWKAFQRAIDEQREEILQALAEDLGGDPEDYRAGTRRSVDAGE